MKLFLINVFPFNFDRWAPKKPPIKDPINSNNNISGGTEPTLTKKIAPVKFQKIPTVKNVKLIALRKSIPKIFIKKIVTSNPLPEEREPFKTPIRKIKIKKIIFWVKLILFFLEDKPKSGLKNE